MADKVFFDTNILVYAFDAEDGARQGTAKALLERHLRDRTAVLSLQVLQEFFVVVTRKIKNPLEPKKARQLAAEFLRHDVVEISAVHLLKAMDLSIALKCSLWDALVVIAAAQAGCKLIYTEDLKHGSSMEGVPIVNPFLQKPKA